MGAAVGGEGAQRLADVRNDSWLARVREATGSLSDEVPSRAMTSPGTIATAPSTSGEANDNMDPPPPTPQAGKARQSPIAGRQTTHEALRSRA